MQSSLSLNGGDWQLKGYLDEVWRRRGAHLSPNGDPHGWIEAAVPGSVHDDLWRAGEIPDPYADRNSLLIEWVSDRTWVYRKSFSVAEERISTRALLIFEGIDYEAEFFLNGELLGAHRGMFSPAMFDIAERLIYGGDNEIAVVVHPAPCGASQTGRTRTIEAHKPRMNYGWDCSPRLVHLGLWDEVRIEFTDAARIDDVFLRSQLSADLQSADVTVTLQVDAIEAVTAQVVVTVLSEVDVAAYERARFNLTPGTQALEIALTIDQPRLWTPNGSGEPLLYSADVALLQPDPVMPDMPTYLDGRTFKLGIRKIEWNAARVGEVGSLSVNGQPIRINGWAWLPLDVLYGVPRPDKLRHLFELLRGANINLLRVWGGGLIERDEFYQIADEYGVMVWQELSLIRNLAGESIDDALGDSPEFRALIVHEAEHIVRRKRNHPSLVLWCGGELDLPADHPLITALGEVIRRLDPDRRWLPTSGGIMAQSRTYADTLPPFMHGGAKSAAHRRLLKQTIDAAALLPPDPNNRVWEHRGAEDAGMWAMLGDAFGEIKDLDMLIRASQMMHTEGLRCALDADRRQSNGAVSPVTGCFAPFNEPYPLAVSASAVDYDGTPKPVYHAVVGAYAPLSLTAAFERIAWGGETTFEADVWLANSLSDAQPDHRELLRARLSGLDGQVIAQFKQEVTVPAIGADRVGRIKYPLGSIADEVFFLDLSLHVLPPETGLSAIARYVFTRTHTLSPLLRVPPVRLKAAMRPVDDQPDDWKVFVSNTGDQAALWVWLEDVRAANVRTSEGQEAESNGHVYISYNHFCVLPGEALAIEVHWHQVLPEERALIVCGWNTNRVVVRESRKK